jgi:HEAT repeat protein
MERPKKILDNPFLGSLVLPLAIILIAGLIVFAASKLLFSEKNYKDLVSEMRSKTFGNRWVAALELSKLLNNSKIPEREIPQLVMDLSEIYKNSEDSRTRDFIIVALGTLKSPLAIPPLVFSLEKEKDPSILFHALISLGNSNPPRGFNFSFLEKFLEGQDVALQQATILVLANFSVKSSFPKIEGFLSSPEPSLRFSAAMGLIQEKNLRVVPVVKEILSLKNPKGYTPAQVEGLKLNVLNELEKAKWSEFNEQVYDLSQKDESLKIRAKAFELLKKLKK